MATAQEEALKREQWAQHNALNISVLERYANDFNLAVDDVIQHVFGQTAFGSINSNIGNTFWGFNHRNTATPIPINRDTNGITFFTRPDMNMAPSNIRHSRHFNAFQTKESKSLPRIFRLYMDPELAKIERGSDIITSPLVDNLQAFIPFLSNTCLSASGFEDVTAAESTTKPGIYGESMAYVDGISDKLGVYDITTAYRNMVGDPVPMFVYYWIKYMDNVRRGIMVPRFENVFQKRIDSQTRIYRLILDHTRTYVQKIACTGASHPKFTPIGAAFNYEADKPINDANHQVSITWTGHGLYYMDDFIIRSFNRTVTMLNESMANGVRSSVYEQVPIQFLPMFNYRGYPYINEETKELTWWVDKRVMAAAKAGVSIQVAQAYEATTGD